MTTYAIIPARSGSKGVPRKNVREIAGKPLMGYSIEFATQLGVDRVICSTDSEEFASIAKQCGAEVPFLRSAFAASDTAMEHHILEDLYKNFEERDIRYPDLFLWLRPTFVFREAKAVRECLDLMKHDQALTSCRVVIESESRLYHVDGRHLVPAFEDGGKSMVRRQDVKKGYRVYSTDVFRGSPKNCTERFLGDNVGYVISEKICGLDIDDEIDVLMVENLLKYQKDLVRDYLP